MDGTPEPKTEALTEYALKTYPHIDGGFISFEKIDGVWIVSRQYSWEAN